MENQSLSVDLLLSFLGKLLAWVGNRRNVRVMFLLSVSPLIATEEELRVAIVIFPTETYDQV